MLKRIDQMQDIEGAAAPSYLSVAELSKRFDAVTVVDGIGFEIAAGEFVCILGPSGCGKTTLLRLIAGFERANGGKITQAGSNITALPPEARDFGIVFQSYALFPNRTVAGNIAFGLESVGAPRAERVSRINELLALVGLTDHANKYPSQLSGGQQQRVALARALALAPGLLLLDEPLSALDANVRAYLRDELRALQRRVGVTTIMVTHDQQEALSIADRLLVMNKGRIEQSGSPSNAYENPSNLFVARFLGEMNALPIEAIDAGRIRSQGLKFALDQPVTNVPANSRLCIRPAAVALAAEAQANASAFRAHVSQVTFLGDIIRIRFEPLQVGGEALQAEVSRVRLGALPRIGEAMDVALPVQHLRILSGDN
jgi:iron(III) transport system ATP-binding protein